MSNFDADRFDPEQCLCQGPLHTRGDHAALNDAARTAVAIFQAVLDRGGTHGELVDQALALLQVNACRQCMTFVMVAVTVIVRDSLTIENADAAEHLRRAALILAERD